MIQNVLRALGGIDRYGVVSLLLFGTVFAGVIIWTFAQKRAHLDRMAQVPLENDSDDSLKG
jgi:hypothetical protein